MTVHTHQHVEQEQTRMVRLQGERGSRAGIWTSHAQNEVQALRPDSTVHIKASNFQAFTVRGTKITATLLSSFSIQSVSEILICQLQVVGIKITTEA